VPSRVGSGVMDAVAAADADAEWSELNAKIVSIDLATTFSSCIVQNMGPAILPQPVHAVGCAVQRNVSAVTLQDSPHKTRALSADLHVKFLQYVSTKRFFV
jgi:hypothetical protein